jgi:hypothetical protein
MALLFETLSAWLALNFAVAAFIICQRFVPAKNGWIKMHGELKLAHLKVAHHRHGR